MAKRILLGVLQDYFGRYIDGLNEENLKVAVWAGEINLEGLVLKKEILESLRIPIQIECGHIHKFCVSVPWTRLGSEPVKVTIDGIYLLAKLTGEDEGGGGDQDQGGEDEDGDLHGFHEMETGESSVVDESDQHHRKKGKEKKIPRRILEKRIRLRWANLLAAGGKGDESEDDGGGENKDSFWSRLASKIMDNLQITVTNVHIRLEDYMSIPGRPYAVGVTFEEFCATTCDEKGNPVFLERLRHEESGKTIHKSVHLKSLGAYWDAGKKMICNEDGHLRTESDFVYLLGRGIWREEMMVEYRRKSQAREKLLEYRDLHHFLLKPCSPSMLVAKNESSDFSKPRYQLDVNFHSIDALVSQDQFQMMAAIKRSFDQYSVLSVYREHRPLDSPLEDPRAWWKYAYVCVKIRNAAIKLSMASSEEAMEEDEQTFAELTKKSRKTDWLGLVRQVRLREEYIDLYKLLVSTKDGETRSDDELARVQDLEDELEVESTLAYRATALAELAAEAKKANSNAAETSGTRGQWLRSWFVQQEEEKVTDGSVGDSPTAPSHGLTQDEKTEILEAVNFFEQTQHQAIPEGTVNVNIKSKLRHGSLALVDSGYDKVLYAADIGGKHVLETKFGNFWSHEFVMKTLTLRDHTPEAGSHSLVLSPKYEEEVAGSASTGKGVAFVFKVDYSPPKYDEELGVKGKPIRKEAYKVRIAAVPFRVVLLPRLVNDLSLFFVPSKKIRTWFEQFHDHLQQQQQTTLDTLGQAANFALEDVDDRQIAERRRRSSEHADDIMEVDHHGPDANWIAQYMEQSSKSGGKQVDESKSFVTSNLKPDMDVQVAISAPILIFPITSQLPTNRKDSSGSRQESLLLLDLGHFSVNRDDIAVRRSQSTVALDTLSASVSASSSGTTPEELAGDEKKNENPQQSYGIADAEMEGDDDEDEFFDALEYELQDCASSVSGSVRGRGESSASSLPGSGDYFGYLASHTQKVAPNAYSDDYGTWKISIERIRSMIITVPAGHSWEAALASSDSNRFRLVDDFDITIDLNHVLSTKKNQRVGVVLESINISIIPSHILFLWTLRCEWLAEEWWWETDNDVDDEETAAVTDDVSTGGISNKNNGITTATTEALYGKSKPSSSLSTSSSSSLSQHSMHHVVTRQSSGGSNRDEKTGAAEEERKTFIHYTFSIGSIRIHAKSDPGAAVDVPGMRDTFLIGQVKGLHVEHLQKRRGAYAHLELRSIDIIDTYTGTGEDGSLVYFARSGDPDQHRLISIDAKWRHTGSDEKSIMYCVARFHKLRVRWNPDTVAAVRYFFWKRFKLVSPTPKRKSSKALQSEPSNTNVLTTENNKQPAVTTRFIVNVSLASLSVGLVKRKVVLADIDITKVLVKFSQGAKSMSMRGELGNVNVMGKGQKLFSVVSQNDALFTFAFVSVPKSSTEGGGGGGMNNELNVKIGASRYVHLNQIYLEILDYINEGIFRALFGESSKVNAGAKLKSAIKGSSEVVSKSNVTNFAIMMEAFEFVVPTSMDVDEENYLAATCESLSASNGKEGKTNVCMKGFRIVTNTAPIIDNPVQFDLVLSKSEETGLIVEGKVSDVLVCLAVEQYWLIQKVFSNNLLADPEPTMIIPFDSRNDDQRQQPLFGSDEETEEVVTKAQKELIEYGYDEEGPGLIFVIDIDLQKASLMLSEGSQMTPESSLACFSMNSFFAHIYRLDPDDCTAVEIKVVSLDLLDRRMINKDNWFRHLILSNPRLLQTARNNNGKQPSSTNKQEEKEQIAFFFRYVHSERTIQLDLNSFRSVFMIDLLGAVISFWVSSPPEEAEEDDFALNNNKNGSSNNVQQQQQQQQQPSDDEILCDWKGTFNLRDSCLCFVADYVNPDSKMIVVRSNISFTWSKCGNPMNKQFSYWCGCLNGIEAYVATTGSPLLLDDMTDDNTVHLLFLQENVQHQILEPTDLNFSYEYEEVAIGSKVHSRRIHLVFSQLELYSSIDDFSLLSLIASNITRKDDNDPLQEIRDQKSRENFASAIKKIQHQDSAKTITSDDEDDDEHESSASSTGKRRAPKVAIEFLDGRIDEDYIEFIVPVGVRDIGLIVEQDHGFLRVSNLYDSQIPGIPYNICKYFGVDVGDYLLEVNGQFVCNESPALIQDRLVAGITPPYTVKFLRKNSDRPVVLQDSLNAGTQKVIFNFIDDLDTGDMPLANLVLGKIDCFVNGSNDGNYIAGAQVEMTGAHFFDLRAGAWGVLLDPCHLSMSCTYYNSGELETTLDIPEPITCNLSDTFIRVLHNSVTVGSKKLKSGTSPNVSRNASYESLGTAGGLPMPGELFPLPDMSLPPPPPPPVVLVKTTPTEQQQSNVNNAFLLRNDTGLPLQFWTSDPNKVIDVPDEPIDIPFGFPHHEGTGRGIIRGFCQYHPISIAFLLRNSQNGALEQVWETLEGVVVSKIGVGVARLIAKKSRRSITPNGLKVKWNVEIDDETRKLKVVLSSLLTVSNHMDYSVRVLANCPLWHGAKSLPWHIEPKQSRNLPLMFGDAIEIRVQPMLPQHLEESASHAYDWSGPIHISLARGSSSTSTDLECCLANGKTRFLCACVQPDEDGVSTIFSLYPQVRLRNLLPQDVIFQEHIPSISVDLPIGGGCIGSGEEQQLHSLTSNSGGGSSLGMCSHLVMKLEYSDWTELIPLRVHGQRKHGGNSSQQGNKNRYRNIGFITGMDSSSSSSFMGSSFVAMPPTGSSTLSRSGTITSNASTRTIDEDDDDDDDDDDEGNNDDGGEKNEVDVDEFEFNDSDEDDEELDSHSKFLSISGARSLSGETSPNPGGTGSESGNSRIQRVVFTDKSGMEVDVCIVCEEAEAGGMLVIIYAECWILNHTFLPLRYGSESGGEWVFPTGLNTAKNDSSVVLFTPEDGKLKIGFERSQSSSSVEVTTPGMSGHILIPGTEGGSYSLNLGVAVDVGPGMLHRTNLISIVPRYTFANYTSCDLCVTQFSGAPADQTGQRQTWVSIGNSIPFWASTSRNMAESEPKFQIRFGLRRLDGQVEAKSQSIPTEWSEPFSVDQIVRKRIPLTVKLRRGMHYEFFQLEAQVGDTAGSIICELSERGMEQMRQRLNDENEEMEGGVTVGGADSQNVDKSKVKKLKSELTINIVRLYLLKDHADITVFHRGTISARKARETRIKEKRAILVQMQQRAPVHVNAKQRASKVATVSIQKFAMSSVSDKDAYHLVVVCHGFFLEDQSYRPMFPVVLAGRSVMGPNQTTKPFLVVDIVKRRSTELGYIHFDNVRGIVQPLELNIDEAFLLSLIDLKGSIMRKNSIIDDESGTAAIETVLAWQLGAVARSARAWALKRSVGGGENNAGENGSSSRHRSSSENVQFPSLRNFPSSDALSVAASVGSNQTRAGAAAAQAKADCIKFKRLFVSEVAIKLSYQQHRDKAKSALLYDLGGGLLSRMNIRVDSAKLSLRAYEKTNFMGSSTTLGSLAQNHYQNEASSSMLQVLSAVNFRNTNFGIAATIRQKLSLTSAKVQSDEFPTRVFKSTEAMLSEYKTRLRPDQGCSNINAMNTILRNLVFDWRNNHRFVYGRRVLVVGVINRTSRHLRITKPSVNRLAKCQVLVPHTELPPGDQVSLLEAWETGQNWNFKGYAGWLVSSKYKESVSAELDCDAFLCKVSVPGEIIVTTKHDFHCSFLYKDIQPTNALYVLAIEDKIGSDAGQLLPLLTV